MHENPADRIRWRTLSSAAHHFGGLRISVILVTERNAASAFPIVESRGEHAGFPYDRVGLETEELTMRGEPEFRGAIGTARRAAFWNSIVA